jgi:hypothetical protein
MGCTACIRAHDSAIIQLIRARRPRELRIRGICVCVTHIQLVSGVVSGDPRQIET